MTKNIQVGQIFQDIIKLEYEPDIPVIPSRKHIARLNKLYGKPIASINNSNRKLIASLKKLNGASQLL